MHLVRNCGASKHSALSGAGDCCSQKGFLASGICGMQSTVPKQNNCAVSTAQVPGLTF